MSFTNAIQDMMVLQMHPDREVTKAAMQSFVKQQQSETDRLALETVTSAEKLLSKAKESGAPQSVIDAYERIITRASSV